MIIISDGSGKLLGALAFLCLKMTHAKQSLVVLIVRSNVIFRMLFFLKLTFTSFANLLIVPFLSLSNRPANIDLSWE